LEPFAVSFLPNDRINLQFINNMDEMAGNRILFISRFSGHFAASFAFAADWAKRSPSPLLFSRKLLPAQSL
jgi:hypothetical protein